MRRRLILLLPCCALLPLAATAAPVPIAAERAVAAPRTDPGGGVCATAVHLSGDNILTSTDVARFYLAQPAGANNVDGRIQARYATINMRNGDSGAQTDHEGALPLPFSTAAGAPVAGNNNNIALRARGYVSITRPGVYTFGVLANDGYNLSIAGQEVMKSTYTDVSLRDSRQVSFAAMGLYPIELVYFQKNGAAVLELTRADQEDAEVAAAPGALPTSFKPIPAAALYSAVAGQSECTECGNDAACGAGAGRYCRDGLCQSCILPNHCGLDCQVCPTATPACYGMKCVECSSDDTSVCDRKGQLCQQNSCVACTADTQCGTGKICDTAFGQCVLTPSTQYGGGCSATPHGPGASGSPLAFGLGALLALGALALLRRRRRTAGLLAIAAAGLFGGDASAQVITQDPTMPTPTPASPSGTGAVGSVSFNTQTFRPAMPGGVFTVEGTLIGRRMWPMGGVLFEYANRPLRLLLRDTGETYASTVTGALTAHLMPGFSINRFAAVMVDLPVVLYQGFDDRTPGSDAPVTPTAGGVGDLRLIGKLRILNNDDGGFGLAAVPQISFPTGSSASFRGDDTVGVEPRVAADFRFKNGAFIAVNVGVWVRTYNRNVDFGLVRVSDQLRYGLGASVPIKGGLAVAGELTGAAGLSKLEGGPLYTPLEGYLGARYATSSGIEVTAGGGAGFINAVGSPNYRLFAGLAYAPRGPRVPRRDPDRDLPPPPVDADGDGVLGSNDQCPGQAGTAATQGCPDGDGDGIADKLDKCPDKGGAIDKEGCPLPPDGDKDGVADADDKCPDKAGPADTAGCPAEELDGDKDGIKNGTDKCPEQAGPAENNGCPDTDGDKDGIVDRLDKCPERAGVKDAEGCPLLEVGPVAIRLEQPLKFKAGSADLDPSSAPTMAALTKVIAEDPAIKKVKIEVAGSGDKKAAKALAGKRVKALVAVMVAAGVNKKLLQIKPAKAPGGDEIGKVDLIKGKVKAVKAPKAPRAPKADRKNKAPKAP